MTVTSHVTDDAAVDMELFILAEEKSNSATFEDETVDDVSENSNADFADEGVLLQLTVEDDPEPSYNSNGLISHATTESLITKSESDTCLTGYVRNVPSSLSTNSLSDRIVSRRTVSDVAAAQASIFRQYLMDGDVQARISELDTRSSRVCM